MRMCSGEEMSLKTEKELGPRVEKGIRLPWKPYLVLLLSDSGLGVDERNFVRV
jgi:hypothetical protein